MKRTIRLLCLLLFLQFTASAQSYRRSAPPHISIGLKGGVNLASMAFTDIHLSGLPQNKVLRPVGGVFVDLPLSTCISIVPELVYIERGMATHYTHYSGCEVDYSIHSRYVALRLPMLVGVNLTSWFQPYLVAGGDVGYLLGGNMRLQQPGLPSPNLTADLGRANMSPLYLGAFGGLGLRFFMPMNGRRAQLKVEATYNLDFMDTFSAMEHSESANPLNVNAYNVTGKRLPKGIEVTMGLAISLIQEKDACYSFSKNKWK